MAAQLSCNYTYCIDIDNQILIVLVFCESYLARGGPSGRILDRITEFISHESTRIKTEFLFASLVFLAKPACKASFVAGYCLRP